MREIRLHVEGDEKLRSGFRSFFSEFPRGTLKLIATNGTPVQDFVDGIRSHPDAINLLLLDSDEKPELRVQLARYPNDRVFWMIQLMEAWFPADKEALKRYYKRDFRESALPENPRVEQISKRDVLEGLKEFSRRTSKGPYHKTKHAPCVLELVDAELVRGAAPECERLFQQLALMVAR